MNKRIGLQLAMLPLMPGPAIFWTWKQTVYGDVVVQSRAGPISSTLRDSDGRRDVRNAAKGIPGRTSNWVPCPWGMPAEATAEDSWL